MTPGFDLTDFSHSVQPTPTPSFKPTMPVASHVEEVEAAPAPTPGVDKEIIDDNTLIINGHEVRKRADSGKPVSSEGGLLKELHSDHPQINPLPDEVVDRNIKAGII